MLNLLVRLFPGRLLLSIADLRFIEQDNYDKKKRKQKSKQQVIEEIVAEPPEKSGSLKIKEVRAKASTRCISDERLCDWSP